MPITAPLPVVPAGPAAATCCAPSAGIDPALDADRIAALAKALGEPLRVQIVDVLQRSEQDVCQCALIAVLGVHQSLVAYHIKKLTDAGLVRVERRHKWAYYSVWHRRRTGAQRMAEPTTEAPASSTATSWRTRNWHQSRRPAPPYAR